MSLYKAIWSPQGEMFEVAPEAASDLVLNKGWFNTKPVLDHREPDADVEPEMVVTRKRGRGKKLDKPPEE